jgi:Rrf2 family protein
MSSMLRLSEATALGLHAVVYLAERPERATTQQIAERLNASTAHLAKVLQRLTAAGIVRGVRGPNGGFQLDVPTTELRLLDVYEAIEGPFSPSGCLFAQPVCDRIACIMGGLIERLNGEIHDYLTETTVASLTLPETSAARAAVPTRPT